MEKIKAERILFYSSVLRSSTASDSNGTGLELGAWVDLSLPNYLKEQGFRVDVCTRPMEAYGSLVAADARDDPYHLGIFDLDGIVYGNLPTFVRDGVATPVEGLLDLMSSEDSPPTLQTTPVFVTGSLIMGSGAHQLDQVLGYSQVKKYFEMPINPEDITKQVVLGKP